MVSDEASEESEFLSALNASLGFVHETLKDDRIESYDMGEMFWPCYRWDSAKVLYIR